MAEILVIGGGAAGMMAAVFAAKAGANVTLLEKNEKLGKKVYITGKGRCNLTNDCDLDEFLSQVSRNPRFLYSALSFFSSRDMISLMEENGCPVTVQRGKRVFNGRISGAVLADETFLPADAVILACGGLSYPSTGSTGDGFRFAEALGHTVVPASPVLVGLETEETWPKELQGLSLRNVTLNLTSGKKTLYSELGEMLFTHFGISGPLALEASCHLPDPAKGARLSIDLKPGLTREQLDARLRRDFSEAGKKQLKSVLPGLLPASLAEIFPRLCGISPVLPCNQITAAQRETLLTTLKALPLTVKAPRPIAEAIVTRGGVSTREIDPATMESKRIPGLFFAGELIDCDAYTGGFNLQIAWATGHAAGLGAAKKIGKDFSK